MDQTRLNRWNALSPFVFRTIVAVVVVGGAGVGSTAHAQIFYTSHSRSVFAQTNAGSQTFSTTDGGAWSMTAYSYNEFGPAFGRAIQASDLRANRIDFDGTTAAGNQNAFLATCSSSFSVQFTIAEAIPFELVSTGANYLTFVRLNRGATTIFNIQAGDIPNSTTGMLTPGNYSMTVNQSSQGVTGAPDSVNNTSAHFTLHIPTPATGGLLALGVVVCGVRRRR